MSGDNDRMRATDWPPSWSLSRPRIVNGTAGSISLSSHCNQRLFIPGNFGAEPVTLATQSGPLARMPQIATGQEVDKQCYQITESSRESRITVPPPRSRHLV